MNAPIKQDQPSQPKQRHFDNDDIFKFIVIGVVALIIGYFAFVPGREPSDDASSSSDGGTVATTKSETITYHEIGEPFTVDDVVFLVKSAKPVLGVGDKEVVISFTAKNVGNKSIEIGDYMVKLIDNQGREFESNSGWDSTGSINPGITKEGSVTFEVPSDVSNLVAGFRSSTIDLGTAEYGYVKVDL